MFKRRKPFTYNMHQDMSTKEAKALVLKIKYASFTEAVKLVKELEVKPVYTWMKRETQS